MHRISKVLVFAVLLFANAFAFSANWVHQGNDAHGDAWQIDADSIVPERYTVTLWKRIDFRQPYHQIQKGSFLKHAIVQSVIDCTERHAAIMAYRFFDAEDAIIEAKESGGLNLNWPPAHQVPMLGKIMALVCTHDRDDTEVKLLSNSR